MPFWRRIWRQSSRASDAEKRQRERAEVRPEGQRIQRPISLARVQSRLGGGPELEDAREEDRRADVGAADLYDKVVKRKSWC